MKTIFTLVIALAAFTASGQLTTKLEYNYMKNSYGADLDLGKDVKQGYTAKEFDSFKSGKYTITVTQLKRSDNSIAGIMFRSEFKMDGNSIGGNISTYYVLPAVNSKDKKSFGWEEYHNDVRSMDPVELSAISNWISYRLAYEMAANNKPGL